MRKVFALEQSYRESFEPWLFDLSASAPEAPSLSCLFPDESSQRSFFDASLAYGPGGGSRELRAAIAAMYDGFTSDNILLSAGGLEAIRAAAMALVSTGDSVLVQSPSYAAIEQAVADQGGRVVRLAGDAEGRFDLRGVSSEGIGVAFLNSPYGLGGAEVLGMESFAGRLVVDEVYRQIDLAPGARPVSVAERFESAIAVGDLSKPLGMGGLRIGWLASRDTVALAACAEALDYLSGSVSVLSAAAALAAVSRFDYLLESHVARARRNLARLAVFVEEHEDRLDWLAPQRGFTALVKLRGGALPDTSFQRLRDAGVFLIPGSVFGYPEHLRIGLGGGEAGFEAALQSLGAELQSRPCTVVERRTGEVVLLTKAPRRGFGKSRLAARVGEDAAFELAGAFLRDTIDFCVPRATSLYVALEPYEGAAELASSVPSSRIYPQRGGDLGERLCAAFDDAFARGAVSPVLVGSDSPTLPSHLLSMAHRALASHDVVIGPAQDGGYYAIGMKTLHPGLFRDIAWSTDAVLTQTLVRSREAGLSVFCLPYWYDIDTVDDLEKLAQNRLLGAATRRVLAGVSP